MIFYESARPASWIPDVSSPEELLSWMDRIEYGWVDNEGGKHHSFDHSDDLAWFDRVRIISPEKVSRMKVGTCYEQTLFEHAVFGILWPKVETKMVHLQQYENSNHAFLLFKKDGSWWHFEHSFAKFRGIHGPYRTMKRAVEVVKSMMEKFEPVGKGFEWHVMDPKDFRAGMSAKQFYDAVGYNWDHAEKQEN